MTNRISLLYLLKLSSLLFFGCNTSTNPTKILEGFTLPDGFVMEEIISPDSISYPMFASFDNDGRLFVFESTGPNTMGTEEMLKNPPYHIRLLEDSDGDGIFEKNTIFADKIPLPMGGSFYQGSLYIAAPPNIERLTDTNGDGVADKREVILTGWTLHANAATLSGPFIGPDGWFYMPDARRGFNIETKEGSQLKGKGAKIWRCLPDGTRLEEYAGGGFDNSIEIAFMPSGETIGTMTYFVDPQDGQRDAIMHWVEGGVYPKANQVIQDDRMKLTGELMPVMTKLPRVAPSGIMRYSGNAMGEEYNNNLFFAEFNTGRILRQIVKDDGATYSTVTEPFMVASNSDVHPTDVLQDADGSLLVIVTGGWFIEGCPLSRVAKPDVKGGIYRIRKKNADKIDDPWGKELEMDKMTLDQLAKSMSDIRFPVRNKAIELLVQKGETAVGILADLLKSGNEDLRVSAVFALYRINSLKSLQAARFALNDANSVVRTSAARVAGLAKDKNAVDKLITMLDDENLQLRRQVATALGQIGDARATMALLESTIGIEDRFVEHSIIHALTKIADPKLLLDALNHSSPNVKRVAVISLDQMDNSPLSKAHLTQFLSSENSKLRNTGIWLASHRLEWGDVIVDFLEKGMDGLKLSDEELKAVNNLMVTFSNNGDLQRFISKQLNSNEIEASKKLFLLNVIEKSSIQELPSMWIQSLKYLLNSSGSEVKSGVLGLIESRRIPVLDSQLQQLIDSDKTPIDFKLKALSARMMSRPSLSASEFKKVLSYLDPKFESPIRQQASRLLSRAQLLDDQLLEIANGYVANADLILLPSLVDAFKGKNNEKVGLALVAALEKSKDRLDNLSEEGMKVLLSSYPNSVQKSAEPIMENLRSRHAERLSKLQAYEAKLSKGDVGEGRKVFFGKGACSSCHTVGPEGGKFGPDLTNIGEIRSKHDMLEAILYPSASFAREYETSRIVTKANTYTGIIAEQLSDAILVTVGPGPGIRIPRSEIISIETHSVSMMPPGLDQQLTEKEVSDLMAFMEALPYKIERLIETREKNYTMN